MQFNSMGYLIFLILVFSLYWLIPASKRWGLLLAFSYYFYMSWEPKYIILILISTVFSYGFALLIEQRESSNDKKKLLSVGIVLILSLLFVFKYFNFVSDNLVAALRYFALPVQSVTLKLLLPVGISFYTFQTLSYLIDVYRGEIKAETHFGYYALFVTFFPQLVAGPIERPEHLIPQLRKPKNFDYEQAREGLILIAVGLFKKVVIANTLAKGVDTIYNNLSYYSGFILIVATVMFAFQIYCDFGGYSDLAIGSAKLLNINLMQNFNCPYFSTSIKEFWGRWHISLSQWMRDYIYIPLGGSRVSRLKTARNLLLTFLASGLWHGADWTFIIWGGLHGCYQIIENIIGLARKNTDSKRKIFFRWFVTFSLVCFAWIFFRANSLEDALYVMKNMFDGILNPLIYLKTAYEVPRGISKLGTVVLGMEMLLLFYLDWLQYRFSGVSEYLRGKKRYFRYLCYVIFVVIFLLCSVKNTGGEFIYFQF